MSERIPLTSNQKSTVYERDNAQCRKCKSREDLHVHHIVAVMDGGDNDPDNLALLCAQCHREWHVIETWLDESFEAWVNLPPLRTIYWLLFHSERHVISMHGEDSPEDIAYQQFKRSTGWDGLILHAWQIQKEAHV